LVAVAERLEGGGISSGEGNAHLEDQSNPLSALWTLDDKLVQALERGDIRLLRVEWLDAQPDGYSVQRRQALESLEQQGGGLSPLLSRKEAVALFRNGKREVGALSCILQRGSNRPAAFVAPHVLHPDKLLQALAAQMDGSCPGTPIRPESGRCCCGVP